MKEKVTREAPTPKTLIYMGTLGEVIAPTETGMTILFKKGVPTPCPHGMAENLLTHQPMNFKEA